MKVDVVPDVYMLIAIVCYYLDHQTVGGTFFIIALGLAWIKSK
jgi:hypothetical protein